MRLAVILLLLALLPSTALGVTIEDCDLNQDGKVDFLDFVSFAAAYGSATSRYDFNGNGTVDFPDYLGFVGW